MRKIRLVNLTGLGASGMTDYFPPFTVEGYEFCSQVPSSRPPTYVYTAVMASRSNRINRQNGYVQFSHSQEDSILYRGGLMGNRYRPQRRKFIEDILLLASILTSYNWAMYSRRHTSPYPVAAANHLRTISVNSTELEADLAVLISKVKDSAWQKQFDDGFLLRMLLNSSNNTGTESRFLSQIIIWENLYSKLFGTESENLQQIIKEILEYFWPGQVNTSIFLTHRDRASGQSKNILYVLRNQLAHSGKIPIDRHYAEDWMKQLPWEADYATTDKDIKRYLTFFDELTLVVIMKTMGLSPETRSVFNAFNFNDNLRSFLSTGRV